MDNFEKPLETIAFVRRDITAKLRAWPRGQRRFSRWTWEKMLDFTIWYERKAKELQRMMIRRD